MRRRDRSARFNWRLFRNTGLFIVLLFVTIPSFPQSTETKTDSVNLQKSQTEAYLRNLLNDAISKAQNREIIGADLEIDEIIVSEMISKPGNDFFDYFSSGFIWPEAEGDYIIIITEKLWRTSTTQVQIKVNELEVFESFLQPRNSYLEELAEYAILITQQYILNYIEIYRELEGNDRRGTGIY